jgi:signal peptide peptidase SppA
MSNTHHNPACFAHHMGLYLISHSWMEQARNMMALCGSDLLKQYNPQEAYQQMLNAEPITERRELYGITSNGIAIIPIVGLMTKGASKFGTSTLDTRRALRQAVDDPKVNAIMLHMDTPGGSFAGLDELATAIAAASKQKPLHAHADDLIASAGMYAGSQASRLTINQTGEAGSIGTYAVIEDSSGAAEMAGVKVHLIATGKMKGMGAAGVPITEEQIVRMQTMVDNAQGFFSAALMNGRGMTKAQVSELVADGGTYFAKDAKAKGLVDGIETYEAALDRLASKIKPSRRALMARQARALELS